MHTQKRKKSFKLHKLMCKMEQLPEKSIQVVANVIGSHQPRICALKTFYSTI